MTAVLLISHGSRSAQTKEEVLALIRQLKAKLPSMIIECAFLELEEPSIPKGIDLCVSQGATQIIIALNFLNSGRHVDQDIPAIIENAKAQYPQVTFKITTPVGQHPKIPELFFDLIKSA